jgi:hypothetical protein
VWYKAKQARKKEIFSRKKEIKKINQKYFLKRGWKGAVCGTQAVR